LVFSWLSAARHEPLARQVDSTGAAIETIDKELAAQVKADERTRRLMTIPGVGPVTGLRQVELGPHDRPQTRDRGDILRDGWLSFRWVFDDILLGAPDAVGAPSTPSPYSAANEAAEE
jgi:hypothetical protein